MYQENSALNSAELEAPFMLPLADGEAMDDGFTDDIDGLRLDFPQIKVPGGGMLQWELPTAVSLSHPAEMCSTTTARAARTRSRSA